MPAAFLLSLLGAAFTSWSAWGNAIDLCFTAGCTIYQDITIAGISMWWIGTGVFGLLALLAIVGRPGLALFVAATALFLDCLLLLLLAVTAPCASCLIAGVFFALVYAAFRRAAHVKRPLPRSWLLLVWSFLLAANLLNIARNEMGTWAMQESAEPNTKFYFSPSCSACLDGIRALSGRTDVSFYAVSKSEQDTLLIAAMKQAVQRGASLVDALGHASEDPTPVDLRRYTPDMLLLRFALLRNTSYVQNAGGGVLPFIEHLGLPQDNVFRAPRAETKNTPSPRVADSDLPLENAEPAQCRDNACP